MVALTSIATLVYRQRTSSSLAYGSKDLNEHEQDGKLTKSEVDEKPGLVAVGSEEESDESVEEEPEEENLREDAAMAVRS